MECSADASVMPVSQTGTSVPAWGGGAQMECAADDAASLDTADLLDPGVLETARGAAAAQRLALSTDASSVAALHAAAEAWGARQRPTHDDALWRARFAALDEAFEAAEVEYDVLDAQAPQSERDRLYAHMLMLQKRIVQYKKERP